MDSTLLCKGVEANRLYVTASCFTGALEPEDAEKKKHFLQKAVELRLSEWQGWTSSPDRSAMLGAVQAAQALGIYLVEMGECCDARSWLEKALEQGPANVFCAKRYWYFNAMSASLGLFQD